MLVVRYSEIGLKGGNRGAFERQLERNILSLCARSDVPCTVRRVYGRLLVDTALAPDRLRCVFGVSSVSRAQVAGSLDAVRDILRGVLPRADQTFRISCQRLDKSFHLDSRAIASELGAFVARESGAKVRLEGMDVDIVVEVIEGRLFVCGNRVECFGGLPSGIEGVVLLDVAQPRALIAGVLMAKRGCFVVPFARSRAAADFGRAVVDVFSGFCALPGEFKTLSAADLVRVISTDSELSVLADRVGAKALVSTELLPRADASVLPVLSPLVGMTEEELEGYERSFIGCLRV